MLLTGLRVSINHSQDENLKERYGHAILLTENRKPNSMNSNETIKTLVREKYGAIASDSTEAKGCGCGCSSAEAFDMVGDAYASVEGYVPEADLGLGCGVPTELANLQTGQTVLDLGSGAGLDVFTARSIVGATGHVIGVDMTPEMTAKARENAEKLGFDNVTFLQGEIEALPVDSDSIDVVISNCVLNLVPDKPRAFAEVYRVLRPGAHFCVSDIVIEGEMPAAIQRAAELYVGCVSGAMQKSAYLQTIDAAGFADTAILKAREIEIPEGVLQEHLNEGELAHFRASGMKVLSVTVRATKPA